MGIVRLSNFLKSRVPHVYVQSHISQFSFKKVAIDTNLYLYKYKSIFGNDDSRWIDAMISLFCCMWNYDVHPVFVFDGYNKPIEKKEEIASRVSSKDKIKKKITQLKVSLIKFQETEEIDEILITTLDSLLQKSFLNKQITDTVKVKKYLNVISSEIDKLEKQTSSISKENINLIKELFDLCGVTYYQADSEGEQCCAWLSQHGEVDAVLSEDSDVLCYGVTNIIQKFDTKSGNCIRINGSEIHRSINLESHSQFQDFCIMCGTDYNTNIPKVGPVTAFNLISEWKCIDKIKHIDTSILKYQKVRELFQLPTELPDKIAWNKPPKFSELELFFFKNNIRTPIDKVKKSYYNKSFDYVEG
jgi:5'-3' exonuclease